MNCFSHVPSSAAGRWCASCGGRVFASPPSGDAAGGPRLMGLGRRTPFIRPPMKPAAPSWPLDLSLAAAEPDDNPRRSCAVRRHHLLAVRRGFLKPWAGDHDLGERAMPWRGGCRRPP